MSRFNREINRRMTAHYNNEMMLWKESQERCGDKIFWVWIAELLVWCFDPLREMNPNDFRELMKDVSRKIVGYSPNNEIESWVRDERPEYNDYCEEFRISDCFKDCGEYYKRLINDNDELLKEQIIMILSDYILFVAPFVYAEAKKWVSDHYNIVFDEERRLVYKSLFDGYIQNYKGLIKMLKK